MTVANAVSGPLSEEDLERIDAAATMGGLDALVFTGGVGERAPAIRAAAADGLAFLGIEVDSDANRSAVDEEISAAGAPVRTLVITSREDLEIAHQTREVLSGEIPGPSG